MENKREERLGTEKILKLMLTMGLPSLVAQLINLLYNIVDRSYIGHIAGVGAAALTGVGLSLPIIVIVTAFSAFVGGGGAPLAAIALGRGDRERAEKILGNGVTTLLFLSISLMVVFFFIKEPFLYLVGASHATFPYANDYISIYLCGTVFVQITVGLNTFITAQGNSKTAMLSVLIGAVINIILDPIFIFVCGMGVKGAALATVISQGCSAAWVIRFLTSSKASLRIRRKYLRPEWKIVSGTAALGISPFIMQATEALISVTMNSGLSRYGGDMYVGTLTIMQSVMQFVSVPANGFSQGVQPIMSYNYGAGNIDRVKETFRKLFLFTETVSGLIALSAILFPTVFGRLFTNDENLLAMVGRVMPVFMAGMVIFGVQMTCQSTFMALGQAKISLFVAMLRKVILLAPLAFFLPRITNSAMSIYYAEPISDFTSVTVCSLLFLLNFKKILSNGEKKKIEKNPV